MLNKRDFYLKNENGQIMLLVLLLILSISVILSTAVAALILNELKAANNVVKSAQSYYAAEAGVEDAVYRIKNNISYSNPYTFPVGDGTATVDASGPLNNLVITSKGDVNNRIRKVAVNLVATPTTTDVSFNYGVQVGYGGLHMGNNSIINGNVYSNGPIFNPAAGGTSTIIGTAFSATGASAAVDQVNDSPLPPPNSITFGNSSSTEDAAQSFQVSTINTINRVDLYIRKQGNPGNLTARITNSNGSNPGSTTFAQGTISSGSVTSSYGWVSVTFSTNPQLNPGATYWLVLDGGSNASRYYIWAANNSYASGEAKTGEYSGGPWSITNLDGYFRIYLGGTVGSINNIDIGADAYANTITNSDITGVPYCQTGSGNNKLCNTSRPDPSPENMPISDANISQWKTEATAGGTISGDYTPPGASSSLGPVKITGNLTIPIDYVLTITGTVWVQGRIIFNNGARVNLDPSFGTDSGLIFSDGYINIGNGVIFSGSGQAGSYIMALTTNDCNGIGSPTGQVCTTDNSAMYVSNGSQNVVLYTHAGQMKIRQNAITKESTAYKLALDEEAEVTYESGLANAHFSSGPGGNFNILSWQEVE